MISLQCSAASIVLLVSVLGQDSSDNSVTPSHSPASRKLESLIVDHAAHYISTDGHRHSGNDHVVDSEGNSEAAPKPPRFMRRQRHIHLGDEDVEDLEGAENKNEHDDHEDFAGLLEEEGQLDESAQSHQKFIDWTRRRAPPKVDCSYSAWTAFTSCSRTCGVGARKRTRYRKRERNGGKPCVYALTLEQYSCNNHQCPVDCSWSMWGAWGVCSHTCGNGQKTKTRFGSGPFHGGAVCAGGGTATLGCNTFGCPQDCYFQPWSQWGACTKTCVEGGEWGYKTRDRAKVGPFNGGVNCVGHTTDDGLCNGFTCPRDCDVSQWSSWSTCTQTCSVSVMTHGYKIRSRTSTAATNGGKTCAANWQMEHCNNFLCSFDCYFLDWGGWGPCSRSCTTPGEAPGQRIKIRSMVGPGMGGKACLGASEMSLTCNDFICPDDCKWSQWGSFSSCSKTCGVGGRTRERTKSSTGKYGGIDCTGPSVHWEACNGHGCPIDCKWTEWNAWMPCTRTCGPHGTRQRARSYDPSPANGGADCPGAFLEMAPCNTHHCPVDCLYEDWLEWSLCSTSCGDGTKVRTRLKNITEFFGGAECADTASEEADCNYADCPMDCRHSEWGNWTECSATCGEGTRTSIRTLLMAESGGSEECPEGDLNRTEECNEAPCEAEKNSARSLQGQLARWVMLAVVALHHWYMSLRVAHLY